MGRVVVPLLAVGLVRVAVAARVAMVVADDGVGLLTAVAGLVALAVAVGAAVAVAEGIGIGVAAPNWQALNVVVRSKSRSVVRHQRL